MLTSGAASSGPATLTCERGNSELSSVTTSLAAGQPELARTGTSFGGRAEASLAERLAAKAKSSAGPSRTMTYGLAAARTAASSKYSALFAGDSCAAPLPTHQYTFSSGAVCRPFMSKSSASSCQTMSRVSFGGR